MTADTCPMTFVRTRLALERLTEGAVLAVRLRGVEPRDSVPRMAAAQGHTILDRREDPEDPEGLWLLIRRGPRA